MKFLGTLTDGHKTFLQQLGDYISLPCAKLHWQYDKESKNLLYSNHDNTEYNVYALQIGDRIMRSGSVYERVGKEPVEGTHYAKQLHPMWVTGSNYILEWPSMLRCPCQKASWTL